LINPKEEINVIIGRNFRRNESAITDINNLIFDAVTIMTQTINRPSKTSKNRVNENFWKIRMQRQIRNEEKSYH
jgi:hypothetical protein